MKAFERTFIDDLSYAPKEASDEQREYIENMTDGDRAIFWYKYRIWTQDPEDPNPVELSIMSVDSNNYGAAEIGRYDTDEDAAKSYVEYMIETELADRPETDPDFVKLVDALVESREAEIIFDKASQASYIVFRQDKGIPELL